jgi:methyltransferase family protein
MHEIRDAHDQNYRILRTVNYFATAFALKTFSATPATRRFYRMLANLKGSEKPIIHDRAMWIMNSLPNNTGARYLDLGSGWIGAYGLYPALLRDCEVHCFDVADLRHKLDAFKRAVTTVWRNIEKDTAIPALEKRQANVRACAVAEATSYATCYRALNMHYQARADGMPDYPDKTFDAIYSIDVLEHVDRERFDDCSRVWYNLLKPRGLYLAQVGLDDHTAMYQGEFGKRYLRYSERMWRSLLGNKVQYINRLTASQIVNVLEAVGFETAETTCEAITLGPNDVHPDYRWQSETDRQSIRLIYRATKP